EAVPVEPGASLGVDEFAAHPQAGEEGGGHPGPALVEEFDEGLVGADRDDEFRALVVCEEHRDVLTRAGRGEHRVLHPEALHPFLAWGAAVTIAVDDDLCP